MAKIKFCGLRRVEDIRVCNDILPDYIGFVFAPKSKRYIEPEMALNLKNKLSARIQAVGVFVDEAPEKVAQLLSQGVIDLAQLHGHEDESYIQKLRHLTAAPIIQAFSVRSEDDLRRAEESCADYVLLDAAQAGSGKTFDWQLQNKIQRDFFLAGGLNLTNIKEALSIFQPYAIDVSSGIETDGFKDKDKMIAFAQLVRSMNDDK